MEEMQLPPKSNIIFDEADACVFNEVLKAYHDALKTLDEAEPPKRKRGRPRKGEEVSRIVSKRKPPAKQKIVNQTINIIVTSKSELRHILEGK